MNIIMILALLLVLSTIGMGIYASYNEVKGRPAKRFLGINISTFFLLLIGATVVMFTGGQASAAELATDAASNSDGLRYIAAALSTGLACIGAGIAVAVSGSAAIGAISEKESLLGKTIIFVGLAEGVAIYGFVISLMILNA
jgi:V/A-type H+-transporting ATPase subunit K